MSTELLDALHTIAIHTSLDPTTLQHSVETALLAAYHRQMGKALHARVALDLTTGVIHVWAQKTVTDPVTDPRYEISLAEAQALFPTAALQDAFEFEVTPPSFARIAVHTAKQVLRQQIREAQHAQQYARWAPLVGECVPGRVLRADHGRWLIDLDLVEAILNPHEQIPTEPIHPGDHLKFYVTSVRSTTRGPQIFLSRRHPSFVLRLLELEVPELTSGLVRVNQIAREPGVRTKLAVSTDSMLIDPVGACVGPQGTRIESLTKELHGERFDVIPWVDDPAQAIAQAIAPGHALNVQLDPHTRSATVIVPPQDLSSTIGQRGLNVRLASRLTGWRITLQPAPPNPLERLAQSSSA